MTEERRISDSGDKGRKTSDSGLPARVDRKESCPPTGSRDGDADLNLNDLDDEEGDKTEEVVHGAIIPDSSFEHEVRLAVGSERIEDENILAAYMLWGLGLL